MSQLQDTDIRAGRPAGSPTDSFEDRFEDSAAGARLPARVRAFRGRYRKRHIGRRYHGALHLLFTVTVSLAALVFCLLQLHQPAWTAWLTVPLTLVYINLVEYWGHRGPMHHPPQGWRRHLLSGVYRRHTLRHHRFFHADAMAFESHRDYHAVLFPPVLVVFFLLAAVVPIGLLVAWLWGANVGWLYAAAVLGYFLNYELLHFAYHSREEGWIGRLPGMATLWRLHTRHHDPRLMGCYNFNITYPLGDWLFGTLHRDRE